VKKRLLSIFGEIFRERFRTNNFVETRSAVWQAISIYFTIKT